MRIYFDPQVIITETDQYTWIYSPANHRFLKLTKKDSLITEIAKQIIRINGLVDVERLKSYLNSKYGNAPAISKIKQAIYKLCRVNRVFYFNETRFRSSIEKIQKWYSIAENKSPWMAYLHLTHRCNFDCWYCYNRKITKNANDELNLGKWKEIISRLKQQGVREFVMTGGEPLLRDDLYEIIKDTKTSDTKFTLLTNGSLFNTENFNRLNSVVDHFIISLDSLSLDKQARNRSPWGFTNILEALELFSKYAQRKVTVRSVITQSNVGKIDEMRKKLSNNYAIENYETVIFLPNSPEEIRFVPNLPMIVRVDETFPDWFRSFGIRKYKCSACTGIIGVDCQGDVYPCQNFLEEKELRTCNLLEDNWYQKHRMSRVREVFLNLSVDNMTICKDCPYRYLCGGGCPAISWRVYGNLDSHLPFLCKHLKYEAKMRLVNARTEKVGSLSDEY